MPIFYNVCACYLLLDNKSVMWSQHLNLLLNGEAKHCQLSAKRMTILPQRSETQYSSILLRSFNQIQI